jgi:predicted ABC-type ATPase
MTPQLVMLAGPNGAGKSTFHDAFLAGSPLPFLNADQLAAETGIDSFEAARILDATRDQMIESGLGFITETVFSDPQGAKLAMLRKAMDAGFDVTLIYIGIASAEPLTNLARALAFVPAVQLYDNSSADEPYRPVATFERGRLVSRMRGKLPRWALTVLRSPHRRR